MNTIEKKARTEKWIRAMGCTPTSIDDPTALWHLQTNFPAGQPHIMHIVCPKPMPEATIIATKMEFSPEHLKNFGALDNDGKEEFLWELRRTINVIDVDFQMEGVAGLQDCPSGLQVSAVRYDDGLTHDGFAHSMGAVFKTMLSALWTVQRHLSSNGYGTGDRFDFKRMGM